MAGPHKPRVVGESESGVVEEPVRKSVGVKKSTGVKGPGEVLSGGGVQKSVGLKKGRGKDEKT